MVSLCELALSILACLTLCRCASPSTPPYSILVTSYGAVGDGKTDNTAAFTAALEAASNYGGSIVQVPPGTYLINGQLNIPEAVTLQGSFRGPPRSFDTGSILWTTFGHGNASAGPFITMQVDSSIQGLVVHYPQQIGWPAPVPYGPTIRQAGDSPTIRDMLITNPWWMLDLGTITGGRHVVEGVWGQPLYLGIYIDNCFDVGRVNNIHFWPFWNSSQAFFTGWTAQHATAFRLGRSDWQMMNEVFAFAYSVGFHFITGAGGGGGGNYLITNSGADEPGIPVLIDTAWPMQGISFTNCQFFGAMIQISAANSAPIKFTSCAFVGNPPGNMNYNGTDTIIQINGGSLKIDQSDVYMWAQSTPSAPAISVAAGARAAISTTEFRGAGSSGQTVSATTSPVAAAFANGSIGVFTSNMCQGGCGVQTPAGSTNVIIAQNVAF